MTDPTPTPPPCAEYSQLRLLWFVETDPTEKLKAQAAVIEHSRECKICKQVVRAAFAKSTPLPELKQDQAEAIIAKIGKQEDNTECQK